MTINEMKSRKTELGLTNADIAERSCVPKSTIDKIFSGLTKAPRRDTLLAIESVLAKSSSSYDLKPSVQSVNEAADYGYQAATSPTKKHQGEYTLEDYLALPDDVRYELIDGCLYEMAAPHSTHQFMALQIGHQLMNHIEKNGGKCMPGLAPIDVQLDCDDRTIVQPDVIIICNPEVQLKNGRVFGSPDFVLEILSPSTRKRDLTLKLAKYSNAGVRELWYVDPKLLSVLVYDLENLTFPKTYSFNDKIPVQIWNNEFEVDFSKVYDYVKNYMD